jgi:hypothetical protein
MAFGINADGVHVLVDMNGHTLGPTRCARIKHERVRVRECERRALADLSIRCEHTLRAHAASTRCNRSAGLKYTHSPAKLKHTPSAAATGETKACDAVTGETKPSDGGAQKDENNA